MKKQDERSIQNKSWKWFMETYGQPDNEPQLLMHSVILGVGISIPNTIPKQYHEKIRQLIANFIKIQEQLGLVKGVSDCLIHGVNGRCIWVEFKTAKGEQRKAQIRQQKRTEKNGGIYLMPRSLEEFQEQIHKNINWLLNKE